MSAQVRNDPNQIFQQPVLRYTTNLHRAALMLLANETANTCCVHKFPDGTMCYLQRSVFKTIDIRYSNQSEKPHCDLSLTRS